MLASLGCDFCCLQRVRADRTIELIGMWETRRGGQEQQAAREKHRDSTSRAPSHNHGERWVLGKKRCPELRFVGNEKSMSWQFSGSLRECQGPPRPGRKAGDGGFESSGRAWFVLRRTSSHRALAGSPAPFHRAARTSHLGALWAPGASGATPALEAFRAAALGPAAQPSTGEGDKSTRERSRAVSTLSCQIAG